MQLYIIRHCQSENNALWAQNGSSNGRVSDPLLTETGQQQAQMLAQFVARSNASAETDPKDSYNHRQFGFTHLYTSLMERAIQTSSAIATTTGLPLHVWEEIHEGGGIWLADKETGERQGLAGANRAFFEAKYPHVNLPDSLSETGWWNRPYEQRNDVLQRAIQFSQALRQRHGSTDDKVAIVTHGGFTFGLMSALVDLSIRHEKLGEAFRVRTQVNNASISRIDIDQETIQLVYFNRLDHLPANLVT